MSWTKWPSTSSLNGGEAFADVCFALPPERMLREKLEEELGVDLSEKKGLVRSEVRCSHGPWAWWFGQPEATRHCGFC